MKNLYWILLSRNKKNWGGGGDRGGQGCVENGNKNLVTIICAELFQWVDVCFTKRNLLYEVGWLVGWLIGWSVGLVWFGRFGLVWFGWLVP